MISFLVDEFQVVNYVLLGENVALRIQLKKWHTKLDTTKSKMHINEGQKTTFITNLN